MPAPTPRRRQTSPRHRGSVRWPARRRPERPVGPWSTPTAWRPAAVQPGRRPVSYTHLRAHETPEHLVCRLLLEKKKHTYLSKEKKKKKKKQKNKKNTQ